MTLIKGALEFIVGQERFNQLKESALYATAVDSASMSAYWLAPMAASEHIAGLTPTQIFWARVGGTAINVVMGPPYNIVRGLAYNKAGITQETHQAVKLSADAVMSIPLGLAYLGVMLAAGTSEEAALQQMMQSIPLAGFLVLFQGSFMDFGRHQAGLPMTYGKEAKSDAITDVVDGMN